MACEWYCTKGCKSAADCTAKHPAVSCVFEYDAQKLAPEHRWPGEGNPPSAWMAGSTKVYRTYADYCDD